MSLKEQLESIQKYYTDNVSPKIKDEDYITAFAEFTNIPELLKRNEETLKYHSGLGAIVAADILSLALKKEEDVEFCDKHFRTTLAQTILSIKTNNSY
jgi:hypothetical protein